MTLEIIFVFFLIQFLNFMIQVPLQINLPIPVKLQKLLFTLWATPLLSHAVLN